MKKHKITSYQQLIQKSSKNTEWGDAVDRDPNLKWFRKYDRFIDQSYGFLIRNGLSMANVILSLTQ